jgi:hypothetical protein
MTAIVSLAGHSGRASFVSLVLRRGLNNDEPREEDAQRSTPNDPIHDLLHF